MIASKILAVAGLIASASSFTLPGGLEDGFYRAYFDKNGLEVHEFISPPNTTVAEVPASIEARDVYWGFGAGVLESWCGCGFQMVPGDCDQAVADLKNQVGVDGVWIEWYTSYYSIRGAAVAFACNDDYNQVAANGGAADHAGVGIQKLTNAFGYITNQCGLYTAGAMTWQDFWSTSPFTPVMGYQINSPGVDFCGNAEQSGRQHC